MPKTVSLGSPLLWSQTGAPPYSAQPLAGLVPGQQAITQFQHALGATSNVIDCRYLDNLAIQVVMTGNPTGVLNWQGSIDFTPNPNGISNYTPIWSGTWVSLTPAPTAPAGAAYSTLANLTGVAFPWLRVNYVATSGSGFIWGLVSGSSL